MLGFGIAHFSVYVVAVLFGSRWGLAGVSIASVVVHFAFLFVSYRVLLAGRPERTLALLWGDLSAATIGCVALVAPRCRCIWRWRARRRSSTSRSWARPAPART